MARYTHERLAGRFILHGLFRRGPIWYGRVRDTITGQVFERSSRESDRRRAKTAINEWIEEELLPRVTDELRLEAFDPAFREWMALKDARPAYIRALDSARRVFAEAFGGEDIAVCDISLADVERFLADVRKRCAPRPHNRYLSYLRGFFRWAKRRRYTLEDPTDGVPRLREGASRGRALTEEEAGRLVAACRAPKVLKIESEKRGKWEQTDPRDRSYLRLAVLISLLTGLRQKNVLGLRWSHVDLERREIEIPGQEMKNHREHSVPLHPVLLDELRRTLRRQPGASPDSRVLGRDVAEVKKGFKAALKRADLPRTIRWHDLRHTFASWLAVRAPFAVVQRLLGHSLATVTWDYTHLPWSELERAVAKLPLLTGVTCDNRAESAGQG